MKRILATLAALSIATLALAADTKISAYPSMSALGGTEIFLGNQSGTTKTGTALQLATYTLGLGTLGGTLAGAAINLNNNSNFAVNIGTGTSTGTVTLGQNSATPGSFILNGPVTFNAGTAFSGATWGTTSPVWNTAAMTLNDSAASGTSANDYAYSIQAPNFTATGGASVTITNAGTLFVAGPTCTTVVCSNIYGINTTGLIKGSLGLTILGAQVNLNASSNAAVNIGTGTNNTTTTIGGTTAGNNTNLASVSIKVGAVLYASVTAPTISSHFNTSGDSIVAASTAAFQITVGSGTGTTTGAVTMPAATTGWSCEATDVTTPASHAIQQTGSSTTLVTVTDYIRTTGIAQNFANGDKINFICGAF